MSQKYTGGFITKSPVAPTTTAASGIWTLDQQQQAQKAGTWPSPPIFIEDLFSTFLYTGTGAAQTITNGIDLAGKGGLVWQKCRSNAVKNRLFSTAFPVVGDEISSNSTAEISNDGSLTAYSSTGFSIGSSISDTGRTYVTWTFREQPKFFDVVTWTGNGTTQVINHNLGTVPGFIAIKRTNLAEDWWCFHRYDFTQRFKLNAANAAVSTNNQSYLGNNTIAVTPTSTTFTIGSIGGINSSGDTFVAYLFAHDAGGFPVSGGGSTNGITCGTWVGNGAALGAEVNLGYEPQWLLIKDASSGTENWIVVDNMRGMAVEAAAVDSGDALLFPNLTNVEIDRGRINPTSTGFIPKELWNTNGDTYIYIAIRRGPMKTPTVGTSVYNGIARTGNGTATTVSNSGFTPDMVMSAPRTAGPSYGLAFPFDRLRGALKLLETRSTGAEQTGTGTLTGFDTMNGYIVGTDAAFYGAINTNSVTYINWNFKRAPGFFDEVCYTTPGSTFQVVTHNLGVTPELIIVKQRNNTNDWGVQYVPFGSNSAFYLNTADAVGAGGWSYFFTSVTASSITATTSVSGYTAGTYVAYLFATCAGVSKVGSYTGTGALLTVNCGFTSGARFVLIKRSDSTGDWYTYDSARGITSGNDPYLLLNSTAAEVTGTNYIDTDTTGFQVTAAAPAGLNANGGTYIFLAIA